MFCAATQYGTVPLHRTRFPLQLPAIVRWVQPYGGAGECHCKMVSLLPSHVSVPSGAGDVPVCASSPTLFRSLPTFQFPLERETYQFEPADFVYMLMFNATVINGTGREESIGPDWGPPALGGGGGRAARVKGSPEAAGREV